MAIVPGQPKTGPIGSLAGQAGTFNSHCRAIRTMPLRMYPSITSYRPSSSPVSRPHCTLKLRCISLFLHSLQRLNLLLRTAAAASPWLMLMGVHSTTASFASVRTSEQMLNAMHETSLRGSGNFSQRTVAHEEFGHWPSRHAHSLPDRKKRTTHYIRTHTHTRAHTFVPHRRRPQACHVSGGG